MSLHIFRNIKFIRHFFTPNREKQRIDMYWFVIEYYQMLMVFIVFKWLFGTSNEYWIKIPKIQSIAYSTYREIAIYVFWNIDFRLFKKYLLYFFFRNNHVGLKNTWGIIVVFWQALSDYIFLFWVFTTFFFYLNFRKWTILFPFFERSASSSSRGLNCSLQLICSFNFGL